MTELIGPVTSGAAVEMAAALPGLGRLLVDRVISMRTTTPRLSQLGGVPIDYGLPLLGLARPADDRVGVDGRYHPVLSRHPPLRRQPLLGAGRHRLLCIACLVDVLFADLTALTELDLAAAVRRCP